VRWAIAAVWDSDPHLTPTLSAPRGGEGEGKLDPWHTCIAPTHDLSSHTVSSHTVSSLTASFGAAGVAL